jgi:hypothetical protein
MSAVFSPIRCPANPLSFRIIFGLLINRLLRFVDHAGSNTRRNVASRRARYLLRVLLGSPAALASSERFNKDPALAARSDSRRGMAVNRSM